MIHPPIEALVNCFINRLAQRKLDVGEAVGELDAGENLSSFDVGYEQSALVTFQPLDLEGKVVGHCFDSSPMGQIQFLP